MTQLRPFFLLPLFFLAACATSQPPKPAQQLTIAEQVKARQAAFAAQKKAWRAKYVEGKNPTGTITTISGDTYAVAKFGTPEVLAEYYIKPLREGFRYFNEVREIRDNGNDYLIELKSGETVNSTEKPKGPFSRYNPSNDEMERFSEFEFLQRPVAGGVAQPARVPWDAVKTIRINGE
ncbi:MAG: hypothetical protein KGZ83_02460 [Sulfuricella sp.]|nr:hypothetical protein [Sulfuricella sp.]